MIDMISTKSDINYWPTQAVLVPLKQAQPSETATWIVRRENLHTMLKDVDVQGTPFMQDNKGQPPDIIPHRIEWEWMT